MRVRSCIATFVAAGAFAALPVAPAQAAGACNPKGSAGYASSAGVRVFALQGDPAGPRRVYMCAYSQNKRRLLGWDGGPCDGRTVVDRFRLEGPFVAYSAQQCSDDLAATRVVVRSVNTGNVLREAPASTGTTRSEWVPSLELTPTGMVAWIVDLYPPGGSPFTSVPVEDRQVRKIEAGSPKAGETLDTGAAIDSTSLALTGRRGSASRFYWMKGAAPFSDLLQGGSVPKAPAPDATSKCTGKGAKVLAVAGTRRVFSLPAAGGERKIYACQLSQNKRRFLGWQQECQNMTAARDFHFVGAGVVYVEYTCGLAASSDEIVTRSIDTGQVVRRMPAATGTPHPGEEATTTVTGLRVTANGAIVWLGEYDADSAGGIGNVPNDDRQVWKFPGNAPATTIDSGAGIDPGSLALGRYHGTDQGIGNRLYWMKNGAPVTNFIASL